MNTKVCGRPQIKAVACQCIGAALVATFVNGALLFAAPPASAGCQDFGPFGALQQLCDGPIQPDGTWQRCEVGHSAINPVYTTNHCYPLGNNYLLPPFQPPGHID